MDISISKAAWAELIDKLKPIDRFMDGPKLVLLSPNGNIYKISSE